MKTQFVILVIVLLVVVLIASCQANPIKTTYVGEMPCAYFKSLFGPGGLSCDWSKYKEPVLNLDLNEGDDFVYFDNSEDACARIREVYFPNDKMPTPK